jgi:hypothetical protein
MKTIKTNSSKKIEINGGRLIPLVAFFMFVVLVVFTTKPAVAHCDSYDGPVITDARQALETNNVELVLKWINKSQENEIKALFEKTVNLKNGDGEIYRIVEKHFFETLVRLHRETEGAPYTGLKPAGTTKPIIMLTDQAISSGDLDGLLTKLNNHIGQVIREKYKKVQELNKVKNESVEKGREYVHAYVDYTHTVEAVHDIVEHGAGEHAGH